MHILLRRLLPRRRHRSAVTMLALALIGGSPLKAQQPVAEVLEPSPAERAEAGRGAAELLLAPPVNSTLEIRTARRPWLLEKLTGPKKEPSVKMTPPSPPAEIRRPSTDPPSLRQVPTEKPDLGWHLRGGPPNLAAPLIKSGPTIQSDSPVVQDTAPRADVVEPNPTESEATENPMRPTASPKAPIEVSPTAKDTAAEESATEETTTNEPTALPPGENETIRVRELRIDVDGTPMDQTDDEAASEGQPEPVESAEKEEIAEESIPSAQVGDVSPEGVTQELPQIDLDYTGYPRKPLQLTRSVRSMQNMFRATLRYYYARPEDANERSNWGVMHSIMVYGSDTNIKAGNRNYNAIAWIAGNNACRGQKLLIESNGTIAARSGVGLQGHQAQLLAILSLCDVPFDYTLYAGDNRYTVGDLIESEMLACRSGEELTFTLIGLSHYLDTDIAWRNSDGEVWDFERLIREELSQPIVGAACGGTHRLMGYAHALRKRRAEGKPITGQWKRAEIYTRDFINYAYQLQNRDGSMTTDWFEGREDNGDLDRKIQTTGHIVEWLLTITPDSQLQDRRLVSAVRFLLKSMYEERGRDWSIGPKGHALRSLAMYYERVYRSGPAWRSPRTAQSPRSRR